MYIEKFFVLCIRKQPFDFHANKLKEMILDFKIEHYIDEVRTIYSKNFTI